jgi:hypothetical protein
MGETLELFVGFQAARDDIVRLPKNEPDETHG